MNEENETIMNKNKEEIIMNNDIDDKFKTNDAQETLMEHEMNDDNKLVSRVIEFVKFNGEIMCMNFSAKPKEEMSSWEIMDELRKARNYLKTITEDRGTTYRGEAFNEMCDYIWDLENFSQEDFDPSCVWSARYAYNLYNDPHKKNTLVEVRIQEKTETRGYVVFFKEYVLGRNEQFYSQELPVLLVNETNAQAGPGGPVKMLWRYKGKTFIGKIPGPEYIRYTPYYNVLDFLNKIYKQEQVLPILKYVEKILPSMNNSMQLHGVSQSELYWIGNETSVKKILAKAYGKSGVEGLTKHAFGGLNNLATIEEIMGAVHFVRAFKSFKPQFFEQFTPELFEEGLKYRTYAYDEKYNVFKFDFEKYMLTSSLTIKYYHSYIKYFLTAAFERQLFEDWNHHRTTELITAVKDFKRIKSTKIRKAIREHVKRNNLNVDETFDFVNGELRKLNGKDNKIPVGKYTEYDGHKIGKEIKVVMPKTEEDLVEWGATQNNCIGGHASAVANKEKYIFGFKDSQNNWIGHVEISARGELRQLLAKHNNALEEGHYNKIVKWLKSIGVRIPYDFWGVRR